MQLLDQLNPAQSEAVSAPPCHQLIIAGAGSGKTRVLVHRIAWLITQCHTPAYSIMAVTFTNKAANTLKARIEALQGHAMEGAWIGTFHSLCHRLLRQYPFDFDIDPNFQIIDQDDQLKLIKHIQNELSIDEKQFPAKKTQYHINQLKEQATRANALSKNLNNPWEENLHAVYTRYEKMTAKEHLVDFNELILKVVETLVNKPAFAAQIQARFRHILVDEFQDSNALQYQFIKLMSGQTSFVSIVGDDDQSIYSWRGARVENMLSFEHDFPDVMTVRLEQNYRSSATILDAANALIAHNTNRLGKELRTEAGKGEKIQLFCAYNEYEEARYIAQSIQQNHTQGQSYNDMAILYRSNAQSRLIEEQLTRNHIPYKVYGGLRFFDRAEIKDLLAYLRLIVNPLDSSAFLRVVNTPARGIGSQTLEHLQTRSQQASVSLWQASTELLADNALPGRAHKALQSFVSLIEQLQLRLKNDAFANVLEHTMQQCGYLDYLQKASPEQAKSKLENLEELLNACQQFESERLNESSMLSAAHFLANITLDTQGSKDEDAHLDFVQLMTLHSAKGLEYDCVYLAGMEEGLCPHKMALQDGRELEEERRLCYVGITRAKRSLHICHAEHRRMFQQDNFQMRSRFLSEIPTHLTTPVQAGTQSQSSPHTDPHAKRHYWASSMNHLYQQKIPSTEDYMCDSSLSLRLGQAVHHAAFGPGVVLNTEGFGDEARIQVRFKKHGVKWLLATYAKLLEPEEAFCD